MAVTARLDGDSTSRGSLASLFMLFFTRKLGAPRLGPAMRVSQIELFHIRSSDSPQGKDLLLLFLVLAASVAGEVPCSKPRLFACQVLCKQ